jgi:hypothetical protein
MRVPHLLLIVLASLLGVADAASALDRDAVIRRLEDLAEASRRVEFTQPVWDRIDRAAEAAAAEAIAGLLPDPLRSPVRDVLRDVLRDRVAVKVRFADLERIRSATPVRWEQRGPVRIPIPDLPLIDIDVPLVDKVGEIGPLPVIVPEILVR